MDRPAPAILHAPPRSQRRTDVAKTQLAPSRISESQSHPTGVADIGLVDAHTILTLQATAGNAAVASLLAAQAPLQRDAPAAVAPPTEGTDTDRFGIVDHDGAIGKNKDPGLNLRAGPSLSSPIVGRLDHNDHVVVKRELDGGWSYVIVTDGRNKTATGFVSRVYVNTDMPPDASAPDPGATLYRIPNQQRAHDFVRDRYGAATQEKGQDERFFTNVLQFVNDQKGRHFVVTKTTPKKVGAMTTEVDDKELVAGGQIWVPSLDFALSLKGTVSAGSWQRNLVEKLKNIGEKLVGIPVFIAGLLWGALESIKDLFVGLFDLVWGTIKSLGHNLVDAAKGIWDLITSAKKRRALLEAIDVELRNLVEKGSFLRKAFNWGRIIGYATMEVLSFVLLAGATAALKGSKFAARLTKLFEVIQKEPAIQKIVDGASRLSKTKAAQAIINKLGVVADVGKAAIQSKPGRVVGKAVGKTARGAAAVAAAPGRALIRTAEWISKGFKRLVTNSRARKLARQARAKGRVAVNLGGAGAPHEPADAINVNNMAVPRKGIPNLVVADGSDIGELFEPGSIDKIEGHHMAPGVIEWQRAAPGAFKVLKPGGSFEYSYRWANPDAKACAEALSAAGFTDVKVTSDAYVTAKKP